MIRIFDEFQIYMINYIAVLILITFLQSIQAAEDTKRLATQQSYDYNERGEQTKVT